uniref:Stromal cell derived factor 2 like 1 n=1 Tax=Piliocolobus tephrosceles TaxID=591936 RepID=A0A8C9GFP2_9PRIM
MWRAGCGGSAGPVLLGLLLALLVPGGGAAKTGAGLVTCGSVLKLLNTHHRVRLHSHDIKYGSGSGQQSVTGVEASDDANSYWRIRGGSEGGCPRGSPVRCGQAVRLTHVLTGKNLHTHHFPSPLSNNQVSPSRSPQRDSWPVSGVRDSGFQSEPQLLREMEISLQRWLLRTPSGGTQSNSARILPPGAPGPAGGPMGERSEEILLDSSSSGGKWDPAGESTQP